MTRSEQGILKASGSGSEPVSGEVAPRRKRRKSSKSPSSRTLDECRKRGWDAQVVEQTIPKTWIKRDLFGVIDIVAITPDGLLGIQATGGSGNHAARRHKIAAEPRALRWLLAGARLAVWSWDKRGARGKRKLWTLREEPITRELFEPAVARDPDPEQLALQIDLLTHPEAM